MTTDRTIVSLESGRFRFYRMLMQNQQVEVAGRILREHLVDEKIEAMNAQKPALVWPPAKEIPNSPQAAWAHLRGELQELRSVLDAHRVGVASWDKSRKMAEAAADMLVALASCAAALEDQLPANYSSHCKYVRGNCNLFFKEETAVRHFNLLASEVVDRLNLDDSDR
jgi:hypothetical protein